MSFNERTDFKARELKSVHVDAEGSFLKLVIHKNFVNRLNLYNQVTESKHLIFICLFLIILSIAGQHYCGKRDWNRH